MKAPLVPPGTPIINALNAQRQCLVNVFRACVGLPPENFMLLEHKIPSQIKARAQIASQQASMEIDCVSAGSSSTDSHSPLRPTTAGDSTDNETDSRNGDIATKKPRM